MRGEDEKKHGKAKKIGDKDTKQNNNNNKNRREGDKENIGKS